MSRKVLIHMFMTLDGFAENPDEPDTGPEASRQFWDAMWTGPWNDVDTLLLGRRTYEKWAGFWPRFVDDDNEHFRAFARFSTQVDKVVFSRTLRSADWSNSRIVRGPVADEMARLRSLPGKNLVVGGGPRFVQSVLAQELADELYLTVSPNIIGRGKPLFHWEPDPDHEEDVVPQGAPGRHDFRLLNSRAFSSGSLFLHYDISKRNRSRDPVIGPPGSPQNTIPPA